MVHLRWTAAGEELALRTKTLLVNGLPSVETVDSGSRAHLRVVFTDKVRPFREKVEDEPNLNYFTQLLACPKSLLQTFMVRYGCVSCFLFQPYELCSFCVFLIKSVVRGIHQIIQVFNFISEYITFFFLVRSTSALYTVLYVYGLILFHMEHKNSNTALMKYSVIHSVSSGD